MVFNSESRMKDIALSNPAARRVLENAGLDYCCGGAKSLHDACLRANIQEEEILRRLRANARDIGPEDLNWMAVPLCELTRHIRETHHRYVRETAPRLQALANKVATKYGANRAELAEIDRLFTEIRQDMIAHMQKEEQILFPYIDALEGAVNTRRSIEPPFFRTVKNPVQTMMQEHDAAGEHVKRIRALSSDYTAPGDACTSLKALYDGLREFEADLHQHVSLENNVLFPRAVVLEASAR